MHESYQWKNNQWEGNEKDSTVFDPKGKPTIQFYFNWKDGKWIYSRKEEKTHSQENGIQIKAHTNSIWKDNQWEVRYDGYSVHDYQADSTYYKVQRWDEDTKQLHINSLERSYRQGNEQFYESYDWDYDRKLLAGEDKYITEIDTVSQTALSTQYYDWDFNTHQWTPLFRKRPIVQEQAIKIDEYDHYDSEKEGWIAHSRIEETSSDTTSYSLNPMKMQPMNALPPSIEGTDNITDTITVTKTRWIRNHIKQEWQPRHQIINHIIRYSVIPHLTILNRYDTDSSQWVPELMWEDKIDDELIYLWNTKTLAWDNYYKKNIGRHRPHQYYLWDTKTSQWDIKDARDEKTLKFFTALHDRFSIDAEYDYEKRHKGTY